MNKMVINQRNGNIVASQAKLADSWMKRLVGLLSERKLNQGHGLWLLPCKSIHTIGMRFPIDVVFLDSDNQVKKLASSLQPYRICRSARGTQSVLELPSGTISAVQLQCGDRLLIQ